MRRAITGKSDRKEVLEIGFPRRGAMIAQAGQFQTGPTLGVGRIHVGDQRGGKGDPLKLWGKRPWPEGRVLRPQSIVCRTRTKRRRGITWLEVASTSPIIRNPAPQNIWPGTVSMRHHALADQPALPTATQNTHIPTQHIGWLQQAYIPVNRRELTARAGRPDRRPQSAKKKSRGPLLSGPDAKYLSATRRACALSGRLPVLHGDLLGILDLAFAPTLYTVGFHTPTSHLYDRHIVAWISSHVNI